MKLTFSKSLVAAVIGSVVSITAIAQDATGAGATFPAPIYAKWARKLPCQVDNLKLEISLINFLGMNSIGATSPRDSCGLNSL